MARAAILAAFLLTVFSAPVAARDAVDASAPQSLAVTLYRDPDRAPEQAMNREWPRGFAMITETRTVTLPPGESTIRFTGVAEGMVAVSAIVTGLPGGTIEKNRNADLLSPASLIDGTLGNRVTVTRTNPATGKTALRSFLKPGLLKPGLAMAVMTNPFKGGHAAYPRTKTALFHRQNMPQAQKNGLGDSQAVFIIRY